MAKECNDSECTKESCEGCPSSSKKPDFHVDLNGESRIRHVIGIVSGKGGVGKSFVTASLANQMAMMGYRTGIMDADITGPSIPKMYGLQTGVMASNSGMYPKEASNGVKIMSINIILPDEEEPVICRGPVLANMVTQFWTDTIWGDLDYLFVDMPPGTGDVPLTVFQSLDVEGILIVSSPQDLVRMIVAKAYKMAEKMDIPVLGVVENYSYIQCPDCGKKISVFGESHIDEIAAELGTKVLGKMPIRTDYAETADKGEFASVINEYLDEAVVELVKLSK